MLNTTYTQVAATGKGKRRGWPDSAAGPIFDFIVFNAVPGVGTPDAEMSPHQTSPAQQPRC